MGAAPVSPVSGADGRAVVARIDDLCQRRPHRPAGAEEGSDVRAMVGMNVISSLTIPLWQC